MRSNKALCSYPIKADFMKYISINYNIFCILTILLMLNKCHKYCMLNGFQIVKNEIWVKLYQKDYITWLPIVKFKFYC